MFVSQIYVAFIGVKDMDLVEHVHIFGLIGLFSLIFYYAKPRILKRKAEIMV